MKELNLDQVEKAVNGKINNSKFYNKIIKGVVIDSRKDVLDQLFVPFKGEKVDGHTFILDVFNKGCSCALSESLDIVSDDYPIIYVKDMRKAILDLGEYYRQLFSEIMVIGVTGSVGKTTTKDLISSVLNQKYNTIKTEGNYNNEIGLPLTVFRIDNDTQACVLEMGMNHSGEIHNLSKVSKPKIAVITNIGVSHIEYLGSQEGILKAKCEIFDYLDETGKIVLYGDDPFLSTLKNSRENITFYGTNSNNDFYANDVEYNGINSMTFNINQMSTGDSINVRCNVVGNHMILNCLCATAVGLLSGLSLEQIKLGIEAFIPTEKRMNIFTNKNGVTIIDDVYNASPASMKAAIDVLSRAKSKRICILGDMFELGNEAHIYHKELGEYLSNSNIEYVLTHGELSQNICTAITNKNIIANHFMDIYELIAFANEISQSGDTVLVKASRGMAFERIVNAL